MTIYEVVEYITEDIKIGNIWKSLPMSGLQVVHTSFTLMN